MIKVHPAPKIIMAGVFTLVASFVYNLAFAGIPYHDAPAEIAQRYEFHFRISEYIFYLGLLLILVGVGMFVVTKLGKK